MLRRLSFIFTLTFICLLGCGAHSAAMRGDSRAQVAPLFVHGDGVGQTGGLKGKVCGFLREGDGRKVVEEELAKAGLRFQADGLTIDSVEFPVTGLVGEMGAKALGLADTSRTWIGKLVLDGFDAAHNVAYEYVSVEDYSSWAVRDSSVRVYDAMYTTDTRGGAEKLRQSLAHIHPKATIALFYDPILTPEKAGVQATSWEEMNTLVPRLSVPELRMQMQDFVTWYKQQGRP